jgi:GNAT superfamily N-acetyltransferase
VTERPTPDWSLRAASADDARWIAELRAVVLRPDLERLGRYDPIRVRQRFLSAFDPAVTQVVVADGRDAGSIAVRRAGDAEWIEHFYLSPELQGRGVGSGVLRNCLASANLPFRLNVLQGSRARALYERNGFIVESEDPVDVFMVRPRSSPRA